MDDTMIPRYTTTLVGRSKETHEILELLHNREHRLVTLTGTSGTGKTRLSLEVISAWQRTEGARPIVFVPLAAINKSELVLPTIARTLGINDSATIDLAAQLITHFQSEPMIIILDNFEQVVAAKHEIAQLIEGTTELQMLVTSQLALELEQETIYEIPGLHTPAQEPATVAQAVQYAAIQLFVERIQAVQPNFSLDQHTIKPVVGICQMLEGLPLAIEIVAAHSEILQPEDLHLLVRQHLDLYRFRSSAATGRQRIILPIIEWSLSRLPDEAQHVFKHLGVFQGGWSYEALAAVVNQAKDDLKATLNLLVSRHLILKQASHHETVRYMMLDAIQDYAATRFQKHDATTRNTILQRHLHFMQQRTSEAKEHIDTDQRLEYWMPHLTLEIPNIRLLLDWSIDTHPEAATEIINNLGRFWALASYWQEALDWSTRLLQTYTPDVNSHALILYRQALYFYFLGKFNESIRVASEALEYAKQADNAESLRLIYNALGIGFMATDNLAAARSYYQQSLAIATVLGSQRGRLVTLGNIAAIDFEEKNYDQALETFEALYALEQEAGYTGKAATSLISIAICHLMRRDFDQVLEKTDQVLDVATAIANKELYGFGLYIKAEALLATQQTGVAAALLESVAVLNEIGSVATLYSVFETCVALFEQRGNIQAAGVVWGAIMALREAKNIPGGNNFLPATQDALDRLTGSPEFTAAMVQGEPYSHDELVALILEQLA